MIVLSAVALATACMLGPLRPAQHIAVYSVAQVQAGLAHHPGIWVGRTVRVRGVAAICLSSDMESDPQRCSHWPTYLVDAAVTGAVLPLAWGRLDAVRAFLRRVPPVSQMIAPPQTPRWWMPASYRVQLRAAAGLCGVPPCYEALLLDAAPNGPLEA
jgi:hypothetical protein